ncbi:MAG: TolC family protein [Myxococcota bacterium]
MGWLVLHLLVPGALALTPVEAVAAALANDPALAEAEARVDAARGARAASLWLRDNPEVYARVGDERIEVEASQAISLTGEGLAAGRVARAEVEAAEAALSRARLIAAAEARRTYVHAVVAEADLAVSADERDTAKKVRAAAEARLAAGDAPELEARLARLEEARATAAWLRALDAAAEARAELAARVGGPVEDLAGDPLAAAPREGEAGERGDVRAAEARAEAAQAALARERAAILPAVEVGVFYEGFGGLGAAGPTLGLEVPLWHRNEAGVGAAKGEVRAADAAVASTRARAEEEARAAAERLEAVRAGLPDISGDAEAALAAIDRAVAAGELGALDAATLRARVYEGQRGWFEARAAEAEARIAAALALGSEGLLVP